MSAMRGFFLFMVSCACLAALVSARAFRRHGEPELFRSMLALSLWCLTALVELFLRDETLMYWNARVQYVGIFLSVPFLLAFAVRYSGGGFVAKAALALSWAGAATAILLALTNDFHRWLWLGIEFSEVEGGVCRFVRGPGFYVGVATNYFAIAATLALLAGKAWRARASLFRAQSVLVVAGAALPFGLNVMNVVFRDLTTSLDFSPVAFAVTGALLAWSVAKLKFFTLAPVARSIAFDAIADPVVVFDPGDRAVDANRAALALFGEAGFGFAGSDPVSLFGRDSALAGLFGEADEERRDLEVSLPDGSSRVFDAAVTRLGKGEGRILRMTDITARARVEREERDQRRFAEGLRDVALAITTTLDPERVFERLSRAVFDSVPCFACNIMLADDEGRLKLVATTGDTHPDVKAWLDKGLLTVDGSPNYRIMVESGTSLVLSDTSKYPYWKNMDPRIRSWIGCPIRIHDALLGFINLDNDVAGFFRQEHADRVKAFADLAAIVVHSAKLFGENERLASVDPLTGLLNRRSFFSRGELEFERARRYGDPFAIMMMDLDDFKMVNDTWGHDAGDKALAKASEALRANTRPFDLLGRFGGDEFCVAMPKADRGSAESAAERLIARVSEAGAAVEGGLSLSVGIASMREAHAGLKDALQDADRALYRAKRAGRGRWSW